MEGNSRQPEFTIGLGWLCFHADDLALDLLVLRALDFYFLIVHLIRHFGADYEVGGVYGYLAVRAADVIFAFGGEGKIIGRVLVLFVLVL